MATKRSKKSKYKSSLSSALPALGLGLLALGAGGYAALRYQRSSGHPHDSAPGFTAKRSRFGDYAVTGRSVTINKPRHELYTFWSDFTNLPKFMENIEKVQYTGDKRSVWTIKVPAGQTVEVETEVVNERENELIAWRSVDGSDIETEGRIEFKDAIGNRGTIVRAIIAYKPPAGEIGRLIAKLFQKEPSIQGRRELRRFKMLMEAGEVAISHHYDHDKKKNKRSNAA